MILPSPVQSSLVTVLMNNYRSINVRINWGTMLILTDLAPRGSLPEKIGDIVTKQLVKSSITINAHMSQTNRSHFSSK